jgi:SAM-dependent methyltransferase
MNRVRTAIASQFHRPTGLLGRLAGEIMTRRASNRARNAWAVGLLEIRPTDHVLEIGYGPGLAIELAARAAPNGMVVGVDHSEVMWRNATRRNAAAIRAGRVELHHAELEALAGPPRFDRVLAVNVHMFWSDPQVRLRQLGALMVPGGVLALAYEPRGAGASNELARAAGEQTAAIVAAAGFVDVRVESLTLRPVNAVCVLARMPD